MSTPQNVPLLGSDSPTGYPSLGLVFLLVAGFTAWRSRATRRVPLNGFQKAVARNMEVSLNVPCFQTSIDIEMNAFQAKYKELKPQGVTMSALLAKACSLALRKHELINSSFENDEIVYKDDINVAIAVTMKDGGLITPVLQKCDTYPVVELSQQWADLVDRARNKKLKPAEFMSGTFTISNLGMFGISHFGAILPPNHGGILAVSQTDKDGYMRVTLTADHRHIYGADSARFLQTLKEIIENCENQPL